MGCPRPQPCLEVLMTDQAQVGAFRREELGQLGFVGAVALRAFTGKQGSMLALPGLQTFLQLAVALIAERILLRDDHSADIARVGVMTDEALLSFEGDMERLSAELLQHVPVALRAEVAI